MSQNPIQTRKYNPNTDQSFVFNAWLKSYRSQEIFRNIPNQLFFAGQQKVVERLINNHETLVITSDDPNQIIGFVNYEVLGNNIILHYVYVKHAFRRMGIAKEVINKVIPYLGNKPVLFSHETRLPKPILEKYKLVFNIFIGMS